MEPGRSGTIGATPASLGLVDDRLHLEWRGGDFGLFVFHVATGTGPLKYRHLLVPSDRSRAPRSTWPPVLDAGVLTRRRSDARTESVHLGGLREVRAKFELAGIWSDLTILALDDGDGLAVVPVTVGKDATWVRDALLPELRSLPGWATAHDDRLERALEYASRQEIGPARGERAEDWAEWEVWTAEP